MSHSHNSAHFTGTKKSKGSKKKAKKGRTNTRKNRKAKRGSAQNKYADLAPKKDPKQTYSADNKKFRRLPISGNPGEVKPAGTIVLFHQRRYRLMKEVTIPESGEAYAECELA